MDHSRPTAASISNSVPIKKEGLSVITGVPQSITTHTSEIDCDTRKNNDPYTCMAHNDVVDELDELDAAMMDVDLEMFDDDLASENQADHREFTNESSAAGVSNVAMEMSLHRTSSLKTISDILTIVKEKYFHGTVKIKVHTCIHIYINSTCVHNTN